MSIDPGDGVTHVLPVSIILKRSLGILVLITAPSLYYFGETDWFYYVYIGFLALVLADCPAPNVRFMILLIALFELINHAGEFFHAFISRVLWKFSPSADWYFYFLLEIGILLVLLFIIPLRSVIFERFLSTYPNFASSKLLVGVELFIYKTFLAILLLQIVTIAISSWLIYQADPSMIDTGKKFYDYMSFVTEKSSLIYCFILLSQILCLQTYMYSKFGKYWYKTVISA